MSHTKHPFTDLQPPAKIVAPTDLGITDEGELFVYISDFLEDTDSASKAAVEWACGAVDEENAKEHSLMLTFSLPEAVEELLAFSNEGTDGEIEIPVKNKPKFDALRTQLIDAIAVLDKVHYKY